MSDVEATCAGLTVIDFAVISNELRWVAGGLGESWQVPLGPQLRINVNLLDVKHWLLSRPVAGECDDLLPLPWIHCLCGHESLGSAEMLVAMRVSGVSDVLNDASEIGRLSTAKSIVFEAMSRSDMS